MMENNNISICDLCDHNIGDSKCGLQKEVYRKARYNDECDGFMLRPITEEYEEPDCNASSISEDKIDEIEDNNSLIDYINNHQ